MSPSRRPPCPSPLPPRPWTPISAKLPGPRLGRRGFPTPQAGAGGPRGASEEPRDFKTPDLTSTDHVGHPLALGLDPSQAPKAHTRMRLPWERKSSPSERPGRGARAWRHPQIRAGREGPGRDVPPHWPPLCPRGLRKSGLGAPNRFTAFLGVKRTPVRTTKNTTGGPEGSF